MSVSRRRVLILVGVVSGLLVLMTLARPILRWTTVDVDLNSGRIRTTTGTGPVTWSEEVTETRVSELIGSSAQAPDWHRIHSHRGWDSARINYRYGGAKGQFETLGWTMDQWNLPAAERPEIARRFLEIFRSEDFVSIRRIDGGFQVVDANGTVFYEWKQTP